MKKIIILYIFLMSIFKRNIVKESAILALNIWCTTLFPVIFPTMILADLFLSTNVSNVINKYLGKFFHKFFNININTTFIFFISLFTGTPTNAHLISILIKNNVISKDDAYNILNLSFIFNPFFVMSFTSIRIWIIIIISNFILLALKKKTRKKQKLLKCNFTFNASTSISSSLNTLTMILGTVVFYMVLSSLIPTLPIISTVISGILEISTGLFKLKYVNDFLKDILSLIFLSFGSISIISQIKSILPDINIKKLLFDRLLATQIGIIICLLTKGI